MRFHFKKKVSSKKVLTVFGSDAKLIKILSCSVTTCLRVRFYFGQVPTSQIIFKGHLLRRTNASNIDEFFSVV